MEEEIYDRIRNGTITNTEAAKSLGIHLNTLTRRLKKAKVHRPVSIRQKAKLKRIKKQDQREAAKRMVPTQMSIEQAAEALNVSTRTIYRYLKS